jgi:small multidrug resistance pump
MPYAFLALAIALEVLGTSMLKNADGFSKLWPTVIALSAFAGSLAAISHAIRTLPLGFSYAVWSGVGTVSAVVIGATFFGKALGAVKLAGVALVVVGVVVLNLGGTH